MTSPYLALGHDSCKISSLNQAKRYSICGQWQYRRNKNQAKINKNPYLKAYIIEKLHERWSPRAIAGRWNFERNNQKISPEAIYQWIYSKEGEKLELKKLLIRAHRKRGLKRHPKAGSTIKNRISIHLRPQNINQRSELGHYEGDLIFNRGSQSKNIFTLVERVTRRALFIRNESKHTGNVIDALIRYIKKTGLIIKSITFDNGSEFSDHNKLRALGIETYFCDPGSPWQKGSIENLNGFIRRFFPFSLRAEEITDRFVATVNERVNNIPRAILGFRTPLEVLREACI